MKTHLLLTLLFLSSYFYAQTAPTGNSPQIFCETQQAQIQNLVVQGENLTCYNAATGGEILSPSTLLTNGTSYWVAQGASAEAERLEIEVIIQNYFPAPIGESEQYFCDNDYYTISDIYYENTIGYNQIFWFNSSNQSTGNILNPITHLQDNQTYYGYQGECGCQYSCIGYLAVTVHLIPKTPQPFGFENQIYCNSITLDDAYCFNTLGGNEVSWASLVDPSIPSTEIVQDGVTYYAYQAAGDCVEMLPVTFHQVANIPAPNGNAVQNVLQNGDVTFAELAVSNTQGFTDIYWYADAEQNVKINPNSLVTNGTYYAFQGIGSCCSPLLVIVNQLESIPAPVAVSLQQFCQTGSSVQDIMYENTSGFDTIYYFADTQLTQLLNPNSPLQNGTYYLTQGLGNDVAFTAVNIELFPTIPLPFAQNHQYICADENLSFSDLVAFNTVGYNYIFWADCHCGGMHHSSDDLITEGLFYASQSMIGCGDTVPVQVHVVSDIPAPIGDAVYTYNETDYITFGSIPIQNTSGFNGIMWYADAQQNTPINPNALVTNGTYYAFQGIGTCAETLAVHFNVEMGGQDNVIGKFKIFPNPTNQFVEIISEDSMIQSVSISNFVGKKVFSQIFSNANSLQIDVSRLAKGIYFLEINSEKNIYTEKLIVE